MTLVLAVAGAQGLTRLVDAVAQRWMLRGRAELLGAVAQLPPGGELTDRAAGGAHWQARRASRGRRR